MSRSPRAARLIVLASLLAVAAALGACADAITAPEPAPRARTTPVSNDGTPPDSTCFSGWIVVDGRWVCEPT